jgi:hypothetical protein
MSTPSLTVLYYTSNREPETFEAKIRQKLLETNVERCPIVSVSHKPISEFETNICIGEHACNNLSRVQQVWIGLHYCTTPFVATAESDFIYPEEYFAFRPEEADPSTLYLFTPIYLLYMWKGPQTKGEFWWKRHSEGAMIGTVQAHLTYMEFIMRSIEPTKKPHELPIIQEWLRTSPDVPQLVANDISEYAPYGHLKHKAYSKRYWKHIQGTAPPVSMRTRYGMSRVFKRPTVSCKELPYWGNSDELRRTFTEGVPEFDVYEK